ncbi:MAG: serpin family protein [Paludibacter sp.]|jgi:serpin B|nr:serpin family protein [Paludibacter sp.]
MKKITFFIIISALTLLGCSSRPRKIVADAAIVAESNAFAFNFFATANAQNPNDENMVLSPLSLNMALAMIWNGANGETRNAIRSTMGMGNHQEKDVNKFFKSIRVGFAATDPNTQLAIANSIWYRPEFPVKQPFIDLNLQYYNARVSKLDFSSPTASQTINQWCAKNTNGLINNMITPPINDSLEMILLNALYFKSIWQKEFEFDIKDTWKSRDFYKSASETIKVPTMFQHNTLKNYKDENLQLVTIPYGNGAFEITFILPDENKSFEEMLAALQQNGYWNNCLINSNLLDTKIYIPKFKVRYDTEDKLIPILTEMGMGVAFNDEQADFSGLSDSSTYIGLVKQKTYIDVNESGTESTAVTAIEKVIEMSDLSFGQKSLIFDADRPFLFVIHETSTNVVLFMGKINNPQYAE